MNMPENSPYRSAQEFIDRMDAAESGWSTATELNLLSREQLEEVARLMVETDQRARAKKAQRSG